MREVRGERGRREGVREVRGERGRREGVREVRGERGRREGVREGRVTLKGDACGTDFECFIEYWIKVLLDNGRLPLCIFVYVWQEVGLDIGI